MTNSCRRTTLLLPHLVWLLSCLSANAFHSTDVVRPVLGAKTPLSVEIKTSHWRPEDENPFLTAKPSITSYRYSTSTSLQAFQLRSFFRLPEIATSSDATTTTASSRGGKRVAVAEASQTALRTLASLQVTAKATKKLQRATQSLSFMNWSETLDRLLQFVLNHWWSVPSFLALVPLYTTYVLGTGDAAMPHWWPVTKMDHILKSPDAASVIGFFLFSNIAYFLSGAYLVSKFPFVRPESGIVGSTIKSSSTAATGSLAAVSSLLVSTKNRLQAIRMIPTRQTWLGLLLLGAGLVSTIFHTEQALGSYAISNSLCYLDHAVAGTATFYYFHTCGRPSPRVWALGGAGLVALSLPLNPGYAWLHSAWHFLSAAAAMLWAVESFGHTSVSPAMVKAIALNCEETEAED